jgi:hypothetical protein
MTLEATYVYSGLQTGRVYELNAKGRPKGTGLTAYTGISVYASKAYSPSLPTVRKVPHVGNDRLLKTQIFPGQEPATADFSVGAEDLDLIAMIGGYTIKEIAGMRLLPYLTDLQGKEKSVGIILSQAALSKLTSTQGYRTTIIPVAKMVLARLAGAGDAPIDNVFDVSINASTNHLWGQPLSAVDVYGVPTGVPETGAAEAGLWSGFTTYETVIASFIAGAGAVFDFPAAEPAANATDLAVFTAGATDDYSVLVDPADYTAMTTGVTFDTPPGAGVEVNILYQKAA